MRRVYQYEHCRSGPRLHQRNGAHEELNMPLFDLLAAAAGRFPEKTALTFSDAGMSFGDLHLHSRQVAARLQKLGIGPGARVAILHENALSAVVFFWGTLGSGAQVVDLPCLAGTETIEGILAECKPAAIVLSAHQLERITRGGAKLLPGIVLMEAAPATMSDVRSYHFLSEIIDSEFPDMALPHIHDTSVALIIYTSGTKGRPKGVMLSHRNLLTNSAAANSRVGLTSEESMLVLVPLYFIQGRMQLLTHMMIGSKVAFSEAFDSPQRVVHELAKHDVTGFSGTPYQFCTLLDRTDIGSCRLPHLKYVLITGGAMPPDRFQSLARALPGVAIHVAYGQVEASSMITHLGPPEVLSNPESSGRPLPGVLVEIVAEDGSGLPAGTVGEVVVSGSNVMCGYVSGDEIASGKIDAFGRLSRRPQIGSYKVSGRASFPRGSGERPRYASGSPGVGCPWHAR
jgi:long-chain acyl-CoA synthetase